MRGGYQLFKLGSRNFGTKQIIENKIWRRNRMQWVEDWEQY